MDSSEVARGPRSVLGAGAARERFEAAAGRLVRTWRLAMVAAACLAAASACVTLAVLTLPASTRVYLWAAFWLATTVVLVHRATRLLPKTPPAPALSTPLAPDDAERVSGWVAASTDGWRPRTVFSALPVVRVERGVLEIGLPLWLCLREHQLAALVRDARELYEAETAPRTARALRIARADLGRGRRVPGSGPWVSRWLVGPIEARVRQLAEAHAGWVDAVRAERDPGWVATAQAADTLVEGWHHLVTTCLAPALERGVWHGDPYTGLALLLESCEMEGIISTEPDRDMTPRAALLLGPTDRYDRALAELLVADAPHGDSPTPWTDHPRVVTEPRWRATFADGLQAAHRATGSPQPATLDALPSLLANGWGTALAAILTPPSAGPAAADASDPRTAAERDTPPDQVLLDLLEAAVCVALLDGRAATMTWSWPHGTSLWGPDGAPLPVRTVVSDTLTHLGTPGGNAHHRLRAWLAGLGVDTATPLWLAGGQHPSPERALWAFEVYRGLRTYHAVVTDRSLRLFRRPPVKATRESVRMAMSGAGSVLQRRMQAVEAGDLTDQWVAVPLASVVGATFAPKLGGHWWRLRLRTPDRRIALRGNGSGRHVEACLAALLGGRLRTRWLHAPSWARRARHGLGFACLSIGGFGLLVAATQLLRPDGLTRMDAVAIAAVSGLVLLLGVLPDLVSTALDRVGRPARDPLRSMLP